MRRDRLLLREVLDAAERVFQLTAGRSAGELEGDRDRRDALLWNFTVLGEAVAQLSPETAALRPDRLWSGPVRMRNRIVHGYWSADIGVLVAAARNDLPGFITEIRGVLADLNDRP